MAQESIWFVVRNGEILYKGTLDECERIAGNDMTGEMEIYPQSAYCRPY